MTEEARKQRDVTTVRFERDVDIHSLLEASNALHINMLPFAPFFIQRFAPSFRHRRQSQGYTFEPLGWQKNL